MSEVVKAFEQIRVLRELPDREKAALMQYGRIEKVPGGKFISRAGSPVKDVSFLIDGHVKICKSDSNGKEATLALLGPGAHIGLVSLLSGKGRSTDVITTCRANLLSFDARNFQSLLRQLPNLSYLLLMSVAMRLEQTSSHFVELALFDLSRRLALRLFELAEVVDLGEGSRLLVRQRPSHQELANMLGASREAVTRSLKQLEMDGHIHVDDNQVFIVSTPF